MKQEEIIDMTPLFISEKFKLQPCKVYQLNTGKGRWYYKFNEGEPVFYQSVTTFISNSLPQSYHLIKWMCDMGYNESKAYMRERGSCGTLMHTLFAEFVLNGELDLDSIKERVTTSLQLNELSPVFHQQWSDDLVRDIICFAQFVLDYQIEFLGMEITLVSDKYGIAGTLDCPCIMNDKLYTDKTEQSKRKRITANIDFKCGRKGFYESHELQLEACRLLWDENFPNEPLSKIYNWSPKDWRTEPTYKLKDQTDSVNLEKLKHFIAIAEIEGKKKLPSIFTHNKKLSLGEPIAGTFKTIGIAEYIKEKHLLI